jgi:hypothetical protein
MESLTADPNSAAHEYPAYFVIVDAEGEDVSKHKLKLSELLPQGQGEIGKNCCRHETTYG